MKTLFVTLAIFVLLCAMTAVNFIYINNVANELISLTEAIDLSEAERSEQLIKEIDVLWDKSAPLFSLSVNFREIDYLGETVLALEAAIKSRNEADVNRYRSLLLDAIDGVSRLERFSVINIL